MARPRASDFEAKRASLLASAAAVLAEQGMERASMARIAAEAGVSKALLYHYYPGREALIFAIIETHLSALDAALDAADDTDFPPEQRLFRLIRTVLDRYRGADDAHKVQLNAAAALDPERQETIRRIERRIVARFAAIIAALRPDLDRGRLMAATMSLFGMLNWVYLWFREDGPLSRDDYARLACDLMLGGLPALAQR